MPTEIAIRALLVPDDLAALAAIDTTVESDRIYAVAADERSFLLREVPTAPPRSKRFPLDELEAELARGDAAFVAVAGAERIGFAVARYERWNRRAILLHLYVDRARRRLGAGRRLLDACLDFARERGARQLWLETQNVNFPAIQFYRRSGFHLCGLDRELYDPGASGDEVALYFARELGS